MDYTEDDLPDFDDYMNVQQPYDYIFDDNGLYDDQLSYGKTGNWNGGWNNYRNRNWNRGWNRNWNRRRRIYPGYYPYYGPGNALLWWWLLFN